ncbi:histidine phosphatase family protein [Thalassotalea aquiviva]|uniref:SixA phosphatase family protein n=1 Tax=Thalassotalea aquiviva TaxID=3242415 RepID=UPI00352B7E36
MNVFCLVRHAKSSWKDPTLTDIQRPINSRGKRSIKLMGQWLMQQNIYAKALYASPAKRAQQTALGLAPFVQACKSDVITQQQLYFHGARAILECIKTTPESFQSIVLVTHNPDITECFNLLHCDHLEHMPTCAVAIFCCTEPWFNFSSKCCHLQGYNVPKNILSE